MPDNENVKSHLENLRDYHLKEAEKISRMLDSINEVYRYLETKKTSTNETQSSFVLTPPVIQGGKPVSVRIREALLKMPDTFSTTDLWKAANEIEGPPIDKRKVFAPFFTGLKNKGEVEVEQPPQGNTPGIWKKGDTKRTKRLLGIKD
jgi:hypothetical protein